MQVILIESVDKLGKVGEIVAVADGFGRNYLLPRKKAIRATKSNITYFEQQRAIIEEENLKKKQDAEDLSKKLEGVAITIVRQAAEDGRLYGSVTSRDIVYAIKVASGIEVPYDHVILNSKFKGIGIYEVFLNLHAEVKGKVLLSIARTEEEGKARLEAAISASASTTSQDGE